MTEAIFSFLFKYRPVVFENGRFALETTRPWLVVAAAAVVAAATAALYLRQRSRRRGVVALIVLRTLAVAAVAFVLLRPVMRVSTAVPGENFLAVLVDDSRSMQLADDGAATRGSQALDALAAPASELRERLEERFTLRYYRFSDAVARMDPGEPLAFDGHATDLGAALDHVRRDLAGVPLAGAVLASDGADNADSELSDSLLQLKSRGVPVYAVGLGEESFHHDLELTRVESPDRVLRGSSYTVEVTVHQQGYDGETRILTVEEDGAIVATREVTFARGQEATSVTLHLEAEDEGFRALRFSIEPDDREQVGDNNARDVWLTVEDRREKILYLEGEPRWEVKFIRQAVAEDDNLHVVVLQRSAENKYLRLGVDDPLELVAGFPETREELFAYRGLVLGSVEADFFTANQLTIIEELVSQRGGGLLFLGGRRSFAEGGWAGAPLENVFPVVMEEAADEAFLAEVEVSPTPAGRIHAALQLGSSAEESAERWAALPPLTIRNPLHRVKPGATVLLRGSPAEGGDELVVLAGQRYGRGRTVALPVQDSWMWQMHADVPLDDMTHERLWRQLLRWLVSAVPDQVELEASQRAFAPGEPVSLRAEVRDAAYLGLNGARVRATVVDPLGEETTVPLEWTVEKDGEYRGAFVPRHPGPYEVRLEAVDAGETVGGDETRLVAADLPTELFGAEMNGDLLRRVARETGGRFYTAANVDDLARDVPYTESGKTVIESRELWDMPAVLLLLLASLSAEWLLRRRWGMV